MLRGLLHYLCVNQDAPLKIDFSFGLGKNKKFDAKIIIYT
jgi:hypothetical protein